MPQLVFYDQCCRKCKVKIQIVHNVPERTKASMLAPEKSRAAIKFILEHLEAGKSLLIGTAADKIHHCTDLIGNSSGQTTRKEYHMEWLIILTLITVSLLFFWHYSSRANLPKIGQQAPDFRLPDQTGKIYTLADFTGKWLALYFYPKDDTPGCTKQACKFRDDFHKITELDAKVIGISIDNTKSHANFAKKYNLQFPLLADNDATVANSYNSLINLGIIRFARRNSFLIDPHGKIARIYFSASTSRNSTEIIADLKKLQTI